MSDSLSIGITLLGLVKISLIWNFLFDLYISVASGKSEKTRSISPFYPWKYPALSFFSNDEGRRNASPTVCLSDHRYQTLDRIFRGEKSFLDSIWENIIFSERTIKREQWRIVEYVVWIYLNSWKRNGEEKSEGIFVSILFFFRIFIFRRLNIWYFLIVQNPSCPLRYNKEMDKIFTFFVTTSETMKQNL